MSKSYVSIVNSRWIERAPYEQKQEIVGSSIKEINEKLPNIKYGVMVKKGTKTIMRKSKTHLTSFIIFFNMMQKKIKEH